MSSTNPRTNSAEVDFNETDEFKLSDNFTDDFDDEDDDDDDYPVTCEDIFGPCQGTDCPAFCSDCLD